MLTFYFVYYHRIGIIDYGKAEIPAVVEHLHRWGVQVTFPCATDISDRKPTVSFHGFLLFPDILPIG